MILLTVFRACVSGKRKRKKKKETDARGGNKTDIAAIAAIGRDRERKQLQVFSSAPHR